MRRSVLALLTLTLALVACQSSQSRPAAASTPAQTVASPSAQPSSPEGSPGSGLGEEVSFPFNCTEQFGGKESGPPVSQSGAKMGNRATYDRFVLDFAGTGWSYRVIPQVTSRFVRPSGQTVTLQGTYGLQIVVHNAAVNPGGNTASDLQASLPVLREAMLIEDFEGTVRWGLGIVGSRCFRAFVLSDPDRLVVDVQH